MNRLRSLGAALIAIAVILGAAALAWGGNESNAAASPVTAVFSTNVNGQVLKVDASASTGPITSYSWDFGDGTTATGEITSHTYGKTGDLTVKLTVKGKQGQTDTAQQVVTVYGAQKSANQCQDGYNVKLNDNQHNKLVSQGVDISNPTQAVNQIMEYAKHDPRILQIYWNASPLGKQSPITSTSSLVDDGCYSAHGRDIYQQTLAQYKTATVKKSTAPANGVNTGAYPGGQAFQEAPGPITGDRRAVQVTFLNGDVVYILHRCGNVVTPKPIPKVPVKPKPSPSPKPTCKTCATTPPGCSHNCHPTSPPCHVCVSPTQVQIPVQESGQPTKADPSAPDKAPSSLQPGPGGNQPPPSSAAPSGYNPSGGSAPGGGESNGGTTTVRSPKPSPTPSQGVPTTDPVATGDPGQPGG